MKYIFTLLVAITIFACSKPDKDECQECLTKTRYSTENGFIIATEIDSPIICGAYIDTIFELDTLGVVPVTKRIITICEKR